jgi:outer membrane cobalamin receptor
VRLYFVVSFGLALAAAAAPARAGEAVSPPAGSVSGVVRTSDGRAVPGVAVILEGPERIRVGTDADGLYSARRLAPGSYSVRVDAPGLAQREVPAVVVGGAGVSQDLVLQPAPVRERVVVSATRGEATLSSLGVAADVVEKERIASREAPTFLTLLSELPGLATARAGQTGQQASLFVRGGESRFARVMVDGVPVNEPGGAYDFGAALPFELERLELVRGAASSLYGTDALAGVVSLETRRARPGERPSLRATGEGGSFGWQRFAGAGSGARGGFDWNAGAQRLQTDNEAPNSAFEATSIAASAGLRFDERTDARLVARFADSTAGTPGQTAFGPADLDSSFAREDLLLSGVLRRAQGRLSHQLRLGYALSDQLSLDPLDSGCHVPEWEGAMASFRSCDFTNPEGFQNRTDRLSAGYQADVSLGARHFVTLGTELEHETGELGNRSEELLRPSRTNLGLYVQDRVLAGSRAYLTLGARLEHNESYGTRLVPRAALAVRLFGGEDAATLRASAGMGIKEPSFLESFGQQLFARGNAFLEPERSTTWDVGIEQRLLGSRLRATATFFHHDYEDQIAYTVVAFDPFEGTYVNLAKTRAQGLELAAESRPVPELSLIGQYTFLDGEIVESPSGFDPIYAAGEPLLRRPRHQGSLGAELTFPRWSAGATLVLVGERADSDFAGIGLTTNPGYARLDARLRVRLVAALEAFVVADNLLDEAYQEALGYPALGRSVRGGLRLRVGGVRP